MLAFTLWTDIKNSITVESVLKDGFTVPEKEKNEVIHSLDTDSTKSYYFVIINNKLRCIGYEEAGDWIELNQKKLEICFQYKQNP